MKHAHRGAFWCAAAAVGFLQIWANRYYVNSDGLSYMELGWSGLWHGLPGFVNAYWSPLYPALLSLVFRAIRPGPAWESTVVHLVNFAIFLANLAYFEVFLRELLLLRKQSPEPSGGRLKLPDQVLWTWGYVFFLWASVMWLRPALITPDLCVAAFCCLAVAVLLRIRRDRGTWNAYLLLGAVLGLAYLAKAFMFLLAWVFLACSVWAATSKRRALPRALAAALIFLIVAAPQILALSRAKGRWTFGDAGALNYAWYVDGIRAYYRFEVPPQAGTLAHPVRQILDRPQMYEFGEPLTVTDPPTFDPSYWYEGMRPYFSLRGQLHALATGLSFILQMFSRSGTLYAVFLVLYLLLRKSGRWAGTGPQQWAVWLPGYVAFGLYSLVHIEPRFVGEFGLMLLMGLFAAVQPSRQRVESRLSSLTLAMTAVALGTILWYAGADFKTILRATPDPPFQVASQIEAMGLSSGHYAGSRVDPIGSSPPRELAGRMDRRAGAYWAHLAGLRVVADMADSAGYWTGDSATRSRVMRKFAELGVRVLVAEVPHPSFPMDGWTLVPGTDFYIYRVQAR